jgi:hypothetical protein
MDPRDVIDRLLPTLAAPKGTVADSAITLTPDELRVFGLRKGPSSKHGGYPGRTYYEPST